MLYCAVVVLNQENLTERFYLGSLQMNKSLTKALAECRQAWEAHPDATLAWCLHHELRLEPLTEPYEARIAYILKYKPKNEQATRLNNFRPVLSKLPAKIIKSGEAYYKTLVACDKARKAHREAILANTTKLQALHIKDVPLHTWNGESIF